MTLPVPREKPAGSEGQNPSLPVLRLPDVLYLWEEVMQMSNFCRDCRWFWEDRRATDYRRDGYYFCRKKGCFFSRNYRIGEGTRIARDQAACAAFEKREGSD